MSDKPKFPRKVACDVARELCAALQPATDRLIVAGSLRRRRAEVGDVEMVYIPRHGLGTQPGELLQQSCNLADNAIAKLEAAGVLARRLSKNGTEAYGPKNKLMVHVPTGLPVDLFATTPAYWWNYLVCRTGPAMLNTLLASRAQEMGYKWHPCHSGFERLSDRQIIPMESERHVFEFLGLRYLEPWERDQLGSENTPIKQQS